MASKATKVRVVRCPKCYKLLHEFPTVPVYKCGGCGITLIAKKIKEDQECESSEALDRKSAQKIVPEHDFEDRDSTCSSQETIVTSTDECEQVDHDCAIENAASRRISSGISSLSELDWQEKEDSSSGAGKNRKAHGNRERKSELENPSSDKQVASGGSNSTLAAPKPYAESESSKINASSLSEELNLSKKIVRRYADLIGSKLPVRTAESTDDGTISDGDMVGNKPTDSVGVLQTPAEKIHYAYDACVFSSDDWGDQVPNLHSHQPNKCLSGSQRVEEIINSKVEAVPKDISVDNRIGTELEVETQARKLSLISVDEKQGLDATTVRLRQVKAVEATNDSSILGDAIAGNKLVGRLGVLEPPATKSYHAYDASISSNDGWGDQASDLQSHQSGSHRVAELISRTGEAIPKDIPINNRVCEVLEVQNQMRKSSMMSGNEKSGLVVTNVSLDQNELPENTKYSIKVEEKVDSHNNAAGLNPVHSWLGLKSEEFKAKKPFGQRDSSTGHERSSPSKYRHNEFSRLSLCAPKKLESVECNQIELLRKVDGLRYQLNRSYVPSRKSNERISMIGNRQKRQNPLYINPSLPDEVMLPHYDVNFPRQSPGTHRPGTSMPLHSDNCQMPLSESVTNCRHHSNCLCSNGYKENWQCVQQLLSPNLCYNERMCQVYPGHVCYSLYSSGPSSPERHLRCHYPLRSGEIHTLPFDQMEKVHAADNLHHRERRQSVKRHCRPIAGAAPFVRCYSCRKVLYLPADTFLSNKRCHQLRCGSCSKVLVFSLQRKTHIIPYSRKIAVASLSEFDSSRASTSMRSSVSAFGANDKPQAEDIVLHSNSVDRKHPLGRIIKSMEALKSKTTAMKFGNKQKSSVRALDAAGSQSSDKASKEELVRRGKGSPLHRLMGYPSVSRILYASGVGT